MQDDWLGDPAPLVRYLAEFAAAGADVLHGALPSGEGACGRNVKVARGAFRECDRGSEDSCGGRERIEGVKKQYPGYLRALRESLWWLRWDRCAGCVESGSLDWRVSEEQATICIAE